MTTQTDRDYLRVFKTVAAEQLSALKEAVVQLRGQLPQLEDEQPLDVSQLSRRERAILAQIRNVEMYVARGKESRALGEGPLAEPDDTSISALLPK